jgi:SnoaL-like domain
MRTDQTSRLTALLDREELFDLVRRERFSRDQMRFDVMRDCFHDDAYVRTSWYDGHGGDAYVEATKKLMARSPGGKHWVFPAFAKANGDRATVESPATIFNRVLLEGVDIDFHVYCRFFSRAVRQNGQWKLLTFEVLWERDEMRPVDFNERLPFKLANLSHFRPSYRFLSYYQKTRGVEVNPNLLGDDRLDELVAFHQKEDAWLAGQP